MSKNFRETLNGSGNPSLKTLKRLAEGMGKTLEIKFL